MSFKNIFSGGAGEADSAEQSTRRLHERIPGAWPERHGIDPELYEDIPDEPRDPKIVSEFAPGALDVVGNILTPMFGNFRTVSADQRNVSENPVSTSAMASSAEKETAKNMKADISQEDRPGQPG